MQPTFSWLEPLVVFNGTGATMPTGIVGWADMGSILVWFVLIAFVGSALGILRERTLGHRPPVYKRKLAHTRLEHTPHRVAVRTG